MNPSHLSFNIEEGEVGDENSEEHSAAVQPDDVEKYNQNSTVGELAENIDSNNSQQSSPSSTPVKLKTLEEINVRCHMCIIELIIIKKLLETKPDRRL